MKNTVKKLSLVIVVMVMTVVCFAFSASAETSGYYTYEISKSQVTITGVDKSISGDVTIPATLGGYPVRVIGDQSFSSCTNLTSVIIPDSVTTIGRNAFGSCTNLTSVKIPDGVTTIAAYAFYQCKNLASITIPDGVTTINEFTFSFCDSLKNITIPNSVTTIGDLAFCACHDLASVTIGNNVTTIGDWAFQSTDIKSVAIPKSVTTIGDKVFYGCQYLTSITVDPENPAYSSDDRGVLFNKDKTVLIQYPERNSATSYTIPNGVTIISDYAFSTCNRLESVTISDSVTTIGDYAFEFSSLKSVTISKSVTNIGRNAFLYCQNLKSITVDSENPAYSSDDRGVLFNKDKTVLIRYPEANTATSYTIPNSVTTIGESAFESCDNLTSVTISKSVTTIDDSAPFRDCTSLTGITVDPENTVYSSDSRGVLFNKDKTVLIKYPQANTAKSYAIPNGVKTIGEFAFEDCDNLTSVTIPDSVTTIAHGGFYDCNNLKSVTIPEGVTTISDSAFAYCSSLTNVTIPYSVTTIDYGAFRDCSSLTDVYYGDSEQQWNKISIVPDDNAALNNATIHYHYHDCTSAITTPSTHLTNGIRTYNCKTCGYSYTESVAKLPEHSYVASQTSAPTCEEKGYTVYVCECGSSYRGNITAANGHNYEGDKCKVCGENKIDNCTCNCHKGGISGFFWKILRFFYKLLGTNKTCACGVSHY